MYTMYNDLYHGESKYPCSCRGNSYIVGKEGTPLHDFCRLY